MIAGIIHTHTRVEPEHTLPPNTFVQLGAVRSLTNTVGAEFGTQYAQHADPALFRIPGTCFCVVVGGTKLLEFLQQRSVNKNIRCELRDLKM